MSPASIVAGYRITGTSRVNGFRLPRVRATFHERQYELAANLEVIAGSSMFFTPMQIIEEAVGYDIALVPGHAAIWTHLGISAAATGFPTPVAYSPALVPVAGGLTFAASLFLQYKRPERMVRRNAVETNARASQGGGLPFYRVRLNIDQHDVLVDLESQLGTDAVVRYAASLFHEIEQLWVHQSTHDVFATSTYVAPSQAGNPPSCWTYDDLGAPIFCSQARRGEAERREDLLRALVRTGRERDRPSGEVHLRTLAAEIAEVDLKAPRRRRPIDDGRTSGEEPEKWAAEIERVPPPFYRSAWLERFRAVAPGRPVAELEVAADAALIANVAAAIGSTWLLATIREQTTESERR